VLHKAMTCNPRSVEIVFVAELQTFVKYIYTKSPGEIWQKFASNLNFTHPIREIL
jgi:hypothetical protein